MKTKRKILPVVQSQKSHEGVIIKLLVQILLLTFSNNLKLKSMGQELDDLTAAVQKDTEVDQSAITLLNGLKAKLDAAIASGDPAALKALSDQLGSNADSLAAAVVANTPAEG